MTAIAEMSTEKQERFYRPIDLTQLQSIQAESAAATTSKKYAFVPTMEVVESLGEKGWLPVRAMENHTRIEARQGFQKHLIRFRNPQFGAIERTAPNGKTDSIFPEIVLSNSHDGTNAFKFMAGLFRLVCSNGLVVASTSYGTMSVKHIGYARQQVFDAISRLSDGLPRTIEMQRQLSNVELSRPEQEIMGRAALVARFGEEKCGDYSVPLLLHNARPEDSGTLWGTYNTLQERLVECGGRFKSSQNSGYYENRGNVAIAARAAHKVQPVKSVNTNLALNQALFTLTTEMAKLKGAELALA